MSITRREVLAAAVGGGLVTTGVAHTEEKSPIPAPDKSPHAAALEIVVRTQIDVIRRAEAPGRIDSEGDELWWHDTKERNWVVKRPFSPGVFDSTHLFDVTYRIDGKDVASWFVDTRKGAATLVEAKKQ